MSDPGIEPRSSEYLSMPYPLNHAGVVEVVREYHCFTTGSDNFFGLPLLRLEY